MADSEDFKQMYWELVGYNIQLKKRISGLENKGTIGFSFTEEQRTEFIETTIFLNSQNLSGRETEDELYKQGIEDCFDDLIEKINEH